MCASGYMRSSQGTRGADRPAHAPRQGGRLIIVLVGADEPPVSVEGEDARERHRRDRVEIAEEEACVVAGEEGERVGEIDTPWAQLRERCRREGMYQAVACSTNSWIFPRSASCWRSGRRRRMSLAAPRRVPLDMLESSSGMDASSSMCVNLGSRPFCPPPSTGPKLSPNNIERHVALAAKIFTYKCGAAVAQNTIFSPALFVLKMIIPGRSSSNYPLLSSPCQILLQLEFFQFLWKRLSRGSVSALHALDIL